MCRHLLPHLDLPFGQIVHGVGRLVASHPASTVVALVVPLVIALVVMAHHRLRHPAEFRLDTARVEPQPLPGSVRLRIAHQG